MAVSVFIRAKNHGQALLTTMWGLSNTQITLFGDMHLSVERAIKTWISAEAYKSCSDPITKLSVTGR